MIITGIVAIGKNNEIGKDNTLPWYLPNDLKFFKRQTLDHPIIMGRKCFESIGKPLPKRTNIILTRDPFFIVSNCLICSNPEEALELASQTETDEVFIIGGGQIYETFMPYLDKLIITQVDVEIPDADIFFPVWDKNEWELTHKKSHSADEKNEYNHTFRTYKRK